MRKIDWTKSNVRCFLMDGFMQKNIIDRLYQSLSELENAITKAKGTLKSSGSVSPSVIERLNSYSSVMQDQRELAAKLCFYINQKNWEEVNRHVSMINCLSSMIRDDAREVLSSLSANSDMGESDSVPHQAMLMN